MHPANIGPDTERPVGGEGYAFRGFFFLYKGAKPRVNERNVSDIR